MSRFVGLTSWDSMIYLIHESTYRPHELKLNDALDSWYKSWISLVELSSSIQLWLSQYKFESSLTESKRSLRATPPFASRKMMHIQTLQLMWVFCPAARACLSFFWNVQRRFWDSEIVFEPVCLILWKMILLDRIIFRENKSNVIFSNSTFEIKKILLKVNFLNKNWFKN